MSILELSKLATDFHIVPQLLTSRELELIFRKVNYGPGSGDRMIRVGAPTADTRLPWIPTKLAI